MLIKLSGHSMQPLICDGDTILVKTYDSPQNISKNMQGKILLFNDKTEWVAHRLFTYKNTFILKGDFAYSSLATSDIKVWGEVCQIQSKDRRINPNRFSHIISALTCRQHVSKNKSIKRLYKAIIYALNKTNRQLFSHHS